MSYSDSFQLAMQKDITELLFLLPIHRAYMAQGQLYCLNVSAQPWSRKSWVVCKSNERFLGQPVVILKHGPVAWKKY